MSIDKRVLVGCLAVFLVPTMVAAENPRVDKLERRAGGALRAGFHAPDLRERAALVEMKEMFVIEDIDVEGADVAGDLILERFRVFGPSAEVLVHGPRGVERMAPPENLYFRGYLRGDPSSRAVVTVRENGGIRGVVLNGERTFMLSDERSDPRGGGPMAMRSLSAAELDQSSRPFACSAELLQGGQSLRQLLPTPQALPKPLPLPGDPFADDGPFLAELGTSYALTIAIETDYEFYQLFGNAGDATDYIADLMSYVSTFYEDEIDTTFELGEISLWSSSSDPWNESSTTCGLFEFGRYWNNTKGGVERGLTHFMSGKNNGGGVAWLDVLCEGSFNYNHRGSCPGLTPQTSNYGGAYGYSGTLDGDFDIDNPSVLWDIVVVAHEIGHNFGSPHSHCYEGIGGNGSAVDQCYTGECGNSGCACGSSSLPTSCPGSAQGCGTIMSYCHLLSGGLSNIAMTFGTDHPYGVEPERVAEHMSSRVQSAASSAPACLAPSNAAPNGTPDSYSVGQDLVLNVSAPGVLNNDSDPDGDSLTASLVSAPSDGTLTLHSNGRFRYEPDGGFSGSDSFVYVANDGTEDSSPTLVSINVESCSELSEVTVQSTTISTSASYEACDQITAGPAVSVVSNGELNLEAATVVLVDGFAVDGGELSVSSR